MPKENWGIVGGGMLGMHLAHRLTQRGEKVTLLEAAPTLGGLTSAWTLGAAHWDKFYHVILASDTTLRQLLTELDLDKDLAFVETRTGFLTDGKLHSMSNTLEFLQFPPLSLLDKFRLGGTIFYASRLRNWKKLEQIPVADWLKRLSGRNTFEKIWLPLLRAKLGEHYRDTSAAFIWATIQRMYAARRSGLKKEMFGYIRGGYAHILDTYTQRLIAEGVRVETGFRLERVESGAGSRLTLHGTEGKALDFDRVVLTIPSPAAARVCPGLTKEERARHRAVPYLGVICASLLLKKRLSPYYVTNITDPSPFTGIIEMTNVVDPAHFGGRHLVYLPKYAHRDDPMFGQSDQEIADHFWTSLKNLHPQLTDEDLESLRVARAPFVFGLSTLGYSQKLPPVRTSVPGLHILNSAHIVNGTLNVNETLQLAERKLPELLAARRKEQTHAHVSE